MVKHIPKDGLVKPSTAWRIRSALRLFPYRVTRIWLFTLGLFVMLWVVVAVELTNAAYIFLIPCAVLLAVYALLLSKILKRVPRAFVDMARRQKALEFPGGWLVYMGNDGFYHIDGDGRVCSVSDAHLEVADVWLGNKSHECDFSYSSFWMPKVLKVLLKKHPRLAIVYA